jgi:hypothetical protein
LENANFNRENLRNPRKSCTFAPEFGKAINFSRQKDGKGDHGGGAWKSSCQIKKYLKFKILPQRYEK